VSPDSAPATALAIAATAILGWAAEPDAPHPLVINQIGGHREINDFRQSLTVLIKGFD